MLAEDLTEGAAEDRVCFLCEVPISGHPAHPMVGGPQAESGCQAGTASRRCPGVREGGGGAVSGSDVSSRRAARQRSLPVTTANASARRMSVVNVTPYASNLVRSRSSTSGRERGVLLRTS